MYSKIGETSSLVMTVDDLASLSDDSYCAYEYVESRDAFFDQPLHSFVIDEVRAMLRIFFMQTPCCISHWNPFYVLMFLILFIVTYPGAVLHWLVICYVPVRISEDLEERELRCQGIYSAIGAAILNIPYSVYGIYNVSSSKNSELLTSHTVTLYVDIAIVFSCLIGLKAITDELGATVRVFVISSFVVNSVLVGLMMCDIPLLVYLDPAIYLEFSLQILTVFISTVVAIQSTHFWDLYTIRRSRKALEDHYLAGTLALVALGMLTGLGVVTYFSVQRGWTPQKP